MSWDTVWCCWHPHGEGCGRHVDPLPEKSFPLRKSFGIVARRRMKIWGWTCKSAESACSVSGMYKSVCYFVLRRPNLSNRHDYNRRGSHGAVDFLSLLISEGHFRSEGFFFFCPCSFRGCRLYRRHQNKKSFHTSKFAASDHVLVSLQSQLIFCLA